MPPSEFSGSYVSSVSHSLYVVHSDGVTGSYLRSAFVGKPAGIDQAGNIWIGGGGVKSHTTRSADVMYNTRPLPPHRSKTVLGDGLMKKAQFIGNIDVIIHSRTNFPIIMTRR